MRKLLVCDLDGTLLDIHNNIDPTTLQSLKDFIADGNDISVCTGRLDEDIKYVEHRLNFKSAFRISQNGAVIRDAQDQIVFQATIAKPLVPMINQILFNQGLRVEVSSINHRYFPSPRPQGQVAEFLDTSIVNPDLAALTETPAFQPVIYLTFGDTDHFRPIVTALKGELGDQINVQQTSPSSLEVFSPKASKGLAVKQIMQWQGYDASQLYVAGDAENDTTMFPLTSNSFAVGDLADAQTIDRASQHVPTVGAIIQQIMEVS
ncbi:HAD hydrolase family protein [Schleiferilactobacillus perolens]|nr:HAD hydrolase family protein [Schleiferilactobacillus perolens]